MRDTEFWWATAERAVRTFCQTLLALLGAGSFGLLDAPWLPSLSAAAMATVLSVLTSLVASGRGGTAGPSLTGAERLADESRPS